MHHCRNLAKAYNGVILQFGRIRSIPGYAESQSGFVSFVISQNHTTNSTPF